MIIRNAKKSEPWEVESSWEWIPSEKRKMQETKEFMLQQHFPFPKMDPHSQSKERKTNTGSSKERNMLDAIQVHQIHPLDKQELQQYYNSPHRQQSNPSIRPGSAIPKLNSANSVSQHASQKMFSPVKNEKQIKGTPGMVAGEMSSKEKMKWNKERKLIEEEQRRIEEFKRYETSKVAKNRNQNLLHFTARFPQKRTEDLEYKPIPLGWPKIPLIEEQEQLPQKGRIPDELDLLARVAQGQANATQTEGINRFKQHIIFFRENQEVPGDRRADSTENEEEKKKKEAAAEALEKERLQNKREAIKIQQEISRLTQKINPKTGKQVSQFPFDSIYQPILVSRIIGIWRPWEARCQLVFGHAQNDESFEQCRCVNQKGNILLFYSIISPYLLIRMQVKAGHVDPGMFRDDHLDQEMEEIREKLRNRSPVNSDIDQEFDDIEQEVQERTKQKQLERLQKEKKKADADEAAKKALFNFDHANDDAEGFFGAEDVEVGDQAITVKHPVTFVTQEKVEPVPKKIAKSTNYSLRSRAAQLMDKLMNEVDFGEGDLIEDYEKEKRRAEDDEAKAAALIGQVEEIYDSDEDNSNQKQKKARSNKVKLKEAQPNISFQNIKGWKMKRPNSNQQLEEEDFLSKKSEQIKKSPGSRSQISELDQDNEEVAEQDGEEQNDEDRNDAGTNENRSEKQQSAKQSTISVGGGDEMDERKALWQQDVLQGGHRAFLDGNQQFDIKKFAACVDEETRDKAKSKAQGEIQKMQERTNQKIEQIKGGSRMNERGTAQVVGKQDKISKVNSRFQNSINQIKSTMDKSKQESSTINTNNPLPGKKNIEQQAKETLKDHSKNNTMRITKNEKKNQEFKFEQREKPEEDQLHPWM